MKLLNTVSKYFQQGNQRSVKAKKNILGSFLIKFTNIIIGIYFVPLLIDFLNPTKYGIWITLSSVIAWFGFFNVGLGNGLRNRLSEAIALGNKALGKSYVSTTYAILTVIFSFIVLIFIIINSLLDWNSILKAGNSIPQDELSSLALIVFAFFCARVVVQLIVTILTADQRPAFASVFDLVAKLLLLVSIFILKHNNDNTLLHIGTLMSGLPVFVLVIANVWLFNSKYKQYRPSIKCIDLSIAKSLFSLGFKFFLIQIAVIMLYQTNNIIISQLFGPASVTPYNVAFKYFSVLSMGFSIVLSPFWSAFTDAWTRNDLTWIRSILKKLIKIWYFMLVAVILMVFVSNTVYSVWIGDAVVVPFMMSLLVGVWTIVNGWNSIYSHLLNGLSKIKLQLLVGFGAACFNIPLALILGKKYGIIGVLSANIIVLIPSTIIYPIQARKLLTGTAKKIWAK